MSRLLSLLVAVAAPALLAAFVFWVVRGPLAGFGPAGVRLGLFLILGGAAFASLMAPGLPRWTEIVGLLAGGAAAAALGKLSGLSTDMAAKGALVALAAWALPWCWSLPLRAAGWEGMARVVALMGFACLIATPYLVPAGWDDLPSWVLEWNPLARLHLSLLQEDWFHGPSLYTRIGERYYVAPGLSDRLLGPLASAGLALIASLAVVGARRRARTRVSA